MKQDFGVGGGGGVTRHINLNEEHNISKGAPCSEVQTFDVITKSRNWMLRFDILVKNVVQ
jgi:hypothetical protein